MQAWHVMQGKKIIDTVFYDSNIDARAVRKSLIEHDGYPDDIRIEKARYEVQA